MVVVRPLSNSLTDSALKAILVVADVVSVVVVVNLVVVIVVDLNVFFV